jgi:hypothetical protein
MPEVSYLSGMGQVYLVEIRLATPVLNLLVITRQEGVAEILINPPNTLNKDICMS